MKSFKKVACDNCGKTFDVNAKVKKVGSRCESVTFKCTHCKGLYVGMIVDPQIKKWQKEIRELQKDSSESADFYTIDKNTVKITTLGIQIKERMNELKNKYYRSAIN